MTMVAALEVWNEHELRTELMRIADSRTSGSREDFYAKAWALISKLRPGRSPEWYLSRVVLQLCKPAWARPKPAVVQPPKTGPLCHWNAGATEHCIGMLCIHYRITDRVCAKDVKFFTRVLGEKAGKEAARCAMQTSPS